MRDGSSSVIRAIVVDDEALSRSNVTALLRREAGIDIVRECSGGFEALTGIRAERPDLVFLDVEMPECDGFDVLEMLGRDVPRAVIFVTAYDRYALRAFEAGALDYLLKPFDDVRFALALERAKQRLREPRAERRTDRLAVKSGGGMVFVDVREIDWIEAADYQSRLHVGSQTHVIRRSMSDIEADLDERAFSRIHRSAIVRLDYVRGLEPSEGGDVDVLLGDGTRLACSRRYRSKLKSLLGVLDAKHRLTSG